VLDSQANKLLKWINYPLVSGPMVWVVFFLNLNGFHLQCGIGANQIYSDGSALLLLSCVLWTESSDRPVFNCRRNSAYTRPAYCLFSCTVRKPGRSCRKIYWSSTPSICVASVQRLKWGGQGAQPPAPIWAPPAIVWAPLIESIKCYFMPN